MRCGLDARRPAPRGRSSRRARGERRDRLVAPGPLRARPLGPLRARAGRRGPLGLSARSARPSSRSPRSPCSSRAAEPPARLEGSPTRPAPASPFSPARTPPSPLVVVGLAVWVAAAGEVGRRDELGFVYSAGDRVVHARDAAPRLAPAGRPARPGGGRSPRPRSSTWRKTLRRQRRSPRRWRSSGGSDSLTARSRERARTLLRRIHSLEAAGDADAAQELAEQMRRLP